ncbi:DNA/RNA non-specific endonuclease [Maribacter chungangensis]|uniref:Endonuclease n=1 Tax=Maribacter chungangensis TaxID=1069117 RepID=A0ABW3B635_9FLAO
MRTYSKNRLIYAILIGLCMVGFWLFENFYTPDTYSSSKRTSADTAFPTILFPNSTTGEIVHHSHFSLSYNEAYEQAEWVAYVLRKEHLTYDDRKRPYFIEDPFVTTKSADWRNYKGSGYDRGHLVPAGDRRFSLQAYNETFYTSNISPQDREFNAGLWNRLEIQTRKWAKRYNTLFVFTGGVLTNGLDEIGDEDVAVPKYYYKIIARKNSDDIEVLGFLMEGFEQNKPLQDFVVPIDRIEELTGLDFFYQLEKEHQNRFETKVRLEHWKF